MVTRGRTITKDGTVTLQLDRNSDHDRGFPGSSPVASSLPVTGMS
jgi:hypothetical protein